MRPSCAADNCRMKKLLLIVNPHSGKKKANRFLLQIVDILNRGGYAVTVYVTASRGDAAEVTAQRAGEFDLLLCIGGDGTFNEMISGLLRSGAKPPVSYIPAGSTNDFATSLHLSKDILQAARDIVEGQPHPLDLGRFNDRYFSYIASFGAFTRASYATSQSLKNALGHFAYILSGIKEITSIRSRHMRFTLADGTVYEDDYIFGAVSNSTSVAGILTLAPDLVDMNDGLFEVLLIRKPHTPLELSDCVLALTTQDYNTPMLTLCSTSRVEVESSEGMCWSLDGEEAEGSAQCVIETLPSAIDIIANLKPKKSC